MFQREDVPKNSNIYILFPLFYVEREQISLKVIQTLGNDKVQVRLTLFFISVEVIYLLFSCLTWLCLLVLPSTEFQSQSMTGGASSRGLASCSSPTPSLCWWTGPRSSRGWSTQLWEVTLLHLLQQYTEWKIPMITAGLSVIHIYCWRLIMVDSVFHWLSIIWIFQWLYCLPCRSCQGS